MIVAEGGRFDGFRLYVSCGKQIYDTTTSGTVHEPIISNAPLPVGHATVTFDFTPDPGGSVLGALLRKVPGSGLASLKLNGQKVGETHFTKFGGFASSIDEPLDIGRDSGSPVSAAYQSPNPYPGRVTRVTIDLL